MRKTSRRSVCISNRAGLTVLDVVVTVAVLLIAAALILPSMRTSRGPTRRAECQNNMKQLVTAMMNYASRHDGQLPALFTPEADEVRKNWVVSLLPELDQAAVGRLWEERQRSHAPFEVLSLKALQCLLDSDSFQEPGGLSYVVNSGYGRFDVSPGDWSVSEVGRHSTRNIDWNGDGTVSDLEEATTRATGVFWTTESGGSATLATIAAGDGQSQTLLVAENLHAGKWDSFEVMDVAFVVGVDRIKFVDRAGKKPLELKSAALGPFAPQGGRIPRHSPAPNANHGGVVVFGFADGIAKQISDKIDPLVYLSLITIDGQRRGERVTNNY